MARTLPVTPRARTGFLLAALLAVASVVAPRCARQDCTINSDCGPRAYCWENSCRADCVEDRDCTDGYCDLNGRCRAGSPPVDSSVDVPVDAVRDTPASEAPPTDTGSPPTDSGTPPTDSGTPPMDSGFPPTDTGFPPPVDTGFPPPTDTGFPPSDTGSPPTDTPVRRAYLDPCATDGECTSGLCVTGADGTRTCTRTCTSRRDCANGQLCAAPLPPSGVRRCMPDDTGTRCDPTTAVPCAQYCYSTSGSAVAHCTHDCSSGADCPSGYGCQLVGSVSVCVLVEQPCSRASDCATGLCLDIGCTSQCRTPADCPRRLPGLTPYTCDLAEGGVRVCNPPRETTPGAQGYVAGGDAMGSSCNATGVNLCRSAVCDDGETPAVCVQGCTPTSGCPAGWGCRPWVVGTELYYVCRRAGSGALGSRCSAGADCATGLCREESPPTAFGYCTRLCGDGVCPTGMRCEDTGLRTEDGLPVSFCTRT